MIHPITGIDLSVETHELLVQVNSHNSNLFLSSLGVVLCLPTRSPCRMTLRTHQVIKLLSGLTLIFCLHNIYISLNSNLSSSRAHLLHAGQEENKHSWFSIIRRLWDGPNPKYDQLANLTGFLYHYDEGEFKERSRKKHSHQVQKILQNNDSAPEVTRPPPPPLYTKRIGNKDIPVPLWQRRLFQKLNQSHSANDYIDDYDHKYFLVELLQVRIYEGDPAKWTVAELKQWMHFMFLAGVEHIYVCDHYRNETEKLEAALNKYIELGLVTYLEWGGIAHPMTAQIKCYQHIINQHKYESIWQIAVDMDEYPFSPNDTEEDFLYRFLKGAPAFVTEVSMLNYLMLGQGDRTRDTVIGRIDRMTPKEANVLVKPIYRPERVQANVHRNHLIMGKRVEAPPKKLRMLHYWGARVQDWGPDTQKTLDITVPMTAMRDGWAEKVRNSLIAFGELDAFSSSTGP